MARTTVASFTDTIYEISPSLPETYDDVGYGALADHVPIDKVQSFLPYGSMRAVNEFRPIRGAIEYTKGSANYGAGDMAMGDMPEDAGQIVLKNAEESINHYSLKITYPDGVIHHLDVINSAWRLTESTEGTSMIRTATLNICKKPVEIVPV